MRRLGCLLLLAAPLSTLTAQASAPRVASGRIGITAQSIRLLTAERGGASTSYDGAVSGVDFLAWFPTSRFGAQLGFLSGDGPQDAGRFSSLALTALYGSPRLAAEAGFMRRSAYSDASNRNLDRNFSVLRLGGRGSTPLGTTDFALGFRGALALPFAIEFDEGASGFDAESELRWQPQFARLSAALGYRFERVKVEGAEHEIGYVTLGAAYRFGRTP